MNVIEKAAVILVGWGSMKTEMRLSTMSPKQQMKASTDMSKHGKKTEIFESGGYKVELECDYYIPGFTLHDLVCIAEDAKTEKDLNDLAANPSLWPEVRAVVRVVEAVKKAYGIEE
jgi:hypothetical protein